jgi:hypothetical protein
MGLAFFLTRFAAKILDFDDTSVPREQMAVINDVIAKRNIEVTGEKANELLGCIKRKYLLNSITVSKPASGLVFSSGGDGHMEAKGAESVIKFVGKSLTKADVVSLKGEREWMTLTQLNGRIYIVRANSAINTVELRALAREIDSVLQKERVS